MFYAFFPWDLSFLAVPLKVWIGLVKIDFWHFCDIHSNIHYDSYIRVDIMVMPRIQFSPTRFKLLMVPLWSWVPLKKQHKTHTKQKCILNELGPMFWKFAIFSSNLFQNFREYEIFKEWVLAHSILFLVGWVFYVSFLSMDLWFTGVPLKVVIRLEKNDFLAFAWDSLFVSLQL